MRPRPLMLILVGSTRPAKVEAARAALEAIGQVNAHFRQAQIEGAPTAVDAEYHPAVGSLDSKRSTR